MTEDKHEEREDIADVLRRLPPIEPPDALVRQTLATVERARASRRWQLGLFLVTAAVALLAFVGIVVSKPGTDAQDMTLAEGPVSTPPAQPRASDLAVEDQVVENGRDELRPDVSRAQGQKVGGLVSLGDATDKLANEGGELDLRKSNGEGELAPEIVSGFDQDLRNDFRYWRAGDDADGKGKDDDGWLDGAQGQLAIEGALRDVTGKESTIVDGRFTVKLEPVDAVTAKTQPSGATVVIEEGYRANGTEVDGNLDVAELPAAEPPPVAKLGNTKDTGGFFAGQQAPGTDIEVAEGKPVFIPEGPVSGLTVEKVPAGTFETTTHDEEEPEETKEEEKEGAKQREVERAAERAASQRLGQELGISGDLDGELALGTKTDAGDVAVTRGPAPVAVEARGYWSDTYVPGDPELAWLRASLATLPMAGERVALEDEAKPVDQPFDAPKNEALALYLASDTPTIDGPTRMTLQVGLAGAKQAPTRRAALDVALVVDVGAVTGDDAQRRMVWSIAGSLVAERQPGDAFAVIVPRADGPRVLKGDALTATEVARFLGEALAQPSGDIAAAMNLAYTTVREASTSTREQIIGAQSVVLVTPRALDGGTLQALAERAHSEALRDVRLSVVGVGAATDGAALATVARAGQGRRWLASDAAAAKRVMADELTAAGKAVARAVRLRIRLAPDVKLYGILGSQRLDTLARQRTKAAEEAIDRKLAETMGVTADRGEDEDGIQIVIPAFMSGDEHVILLDVEVQRPGPVMDVRGRWKDLVRVGNGEAQASLSIGAGDAALTPSAKNVIENRAAAYAGTALLLAARALEAGQAARAEALLRAGHQLVAPLAGKASGARDELTLLARYLDLVRNDPLNAVTARSLAIAGRTLK